jgi:hypothetical protein
MPVERFIFQVRAMEHMTSGNANRKARMRRLYCITVPGDIMKGALSIRSLNVMYEVV